MRTPSLAEGLVGVNAVASILIISHPQVPHFGGVKHWLPSMPFLGILAGVAVTRGCEALVERLRVRWPRLPLAAVAAPVFALLMLPALIGLVRVFPYGTSYYSELAGGVPGAASLGMQRQFWSSNVTAVLPWINEHAPRNGRVFLHEVNGLSFRDYQRNGMLRSDLQPARAVRRGHGGVPVPPGVPRARVQRLAGLRDADAGHGAVPGRDAAGSRLPAPLSDDAARQDDGGFH